jgi:hypothetical protein
MCAAEKMYASTVTSMHALLMAGGEACVASIHKVMLADNTVESQDRQYSCSITGRLVYFRSFGLLVMSC